jgi:dTDP-4-dehydrorhamnose 3,5-epimerase
MMRRARHRGDTLTRFTFTSLDLPGVVLVEPRVHEDERGFFMETFRQLEFEHAGLAGPFVQENHSRSARGTVRGLHFQRPPKAQGKLVRVVVGEIYDVSLDLRPDAPSFGRWVAVTLSAADRRMVYVPPWCAHGFCVVSEYAEVMYKTTAEYAPDLEGGVAWDDPALAIPWPVATPVISARDRQWPTLREAVAAPAAGAGLST